MKKGEFHVSGYSDDCYSVSGPGVPRKYEYDPFILRVGDAYIKLEYEDQSWTATMILPDAQDVELQVFEDTDDKSRFNLLEEAWAQIKKQEGLQ